MKKFQEHQIISQMKSVFHAAENVLNAFPGPTGLSEVEDLRAQVMHLRTLLYCSFCGIDQLAFPEHIEECPHCSGRLHWALDIQRCEFCGYTAPVNIAEALLETDT